MKHRAIAATLPILLACAEASADAPGTWATTIYGARLSAEPTWHDVLVHPFSDSYADVYLIVGALSREYGDMLSGNLLLGAEGQIAYNFGDQDHWELNAMPIVLRWQKFPWNRYIDTSAAFGLGLSYATELPEVEVLQETDSRQTLVYWMLEIAAGPVGAPWKAALRLHHRSVAWGLFGDEGGGNAVGLGVRYEFQH